MVAAVADMAAVGEMVADAAGGTSSVRETFASRVVVVVATVVVVAAMEAAVATVVAMVETAAVATEVVATGEAGMVAMMRGKSKFER